MITDETWRRGVGGVVAAMGAVALAGWALQLPALFRVGATFVPTQPSTAVCFVALGLALIATVRAPALRMGAGLLLVLVSAVTLIQYTTQIGPLFDALFPPQPSGVRPALMSPETGTGLLLMGGLLLAEGRSARRLPVLWRPLCGVAVTLLGAHGLLLYAAEGNEPVAYGEVTGMSVYTGAGFLVVGGWLLAGARPLLRATHPSPALPLVVGAVGTLAAIAGWQAMLTQRGVWLIQVVRATANTTAEVIQDELQARMMVLEVMAEHWEGDAPPLEEWDVEAVRYGAAFPAFIGFAWRDETGAIRWVRPIDEQERFEARLPEVAPLDLLHPSAYIHPRRDTLVLSVPVRHHDTFHGHLVGLLDSQQLAARMVPRDVQDDNMVRLLLNGSEVATISGDPRDRQQAVEEFSLFRAHWTLTVAPERAWVEQLRTGMPELLLVFGTGLALMLAHAMFVSRERELRSNELARSNAALRVEIGAHDEARRALRQANEELEQRVAARTAELRLANEDLSRSNRELDLFAATTAHDLRDPLRTVQLHLQLVCRHLEQAESERLREWLDASDRGLRRMGRMIEDMLAWARVGSQLRLRPVDPRVVLEEVVTGLRARIEENGAEIVVPSAMPTVRADEVQLAQVFQNLISNALKFRREAPPHIEVEATRQGPLVRFRVRDNGRGIPPAQLEQVFGMFARADGSEQTEGTGIGLALCRKIVERHGGRIGAESEPGRGSTFWFTIPAA